MPYRISATLMVVVNNCEVGWLESHRDTLVFGDDDIASEITFVSRMIIRNGHNDHLSFGSGMGSRGGIFKSTPPKGANISLIAFPRSLAGSSDLLSSLLRISRASCSIERP